ncbi:MAG TPA: hydroxyisourate hydrolase [Burkholderiaceae bacterium]|nr:hydroxyisourate hydrolase [Burkholderiaceae bacterium]
MPGISVHVVDVTQGLPAAGMQVTIHAGEGGARRAIARGQIGASGAFVDPVNDGHGVAAGVHEIELAAGEFYRRIGAITDSPAFQEHVLYRFHVTDASQHYHLPIKISPWGLSIWRGR